MERMLVVVFDNEKKAHQGKSALAELQREGGVTVYADANGRSSRSCTLL